MLSEESAEVKSIEARGSGTRVVRTYGEDLEEGVYSLEAAELESVRARLLKQDSEDLRAVVITSATM